MYLKSVELSGFKSFVDRTTFMVRGQLNAIVGPNGCGKSNIVDAIRWVIGETSAKQLRGQSMNDVIFNGTTQRKPVGKATVELIFVNNDGRLTGEYAKYQEISIRREVERDGQSTYFFNGTACRRRDILDIFLGTGLGPRSYSIIEQGMISELIEAKPDELRAHLEEVSGISKYKERRRETEHRIRHTQENLTRLADVIEELDKQLRHLKRQANAAENYQQYKKEEQTLQAQTKALQWREWQQDHQAQDLAIKQQENACEAVIAEQRSLETTIEEIRLLEIQARDAEQGVQKNYYSLGADIARLEQQIAACETQLKQWQQEQQHNLTEQQSLGEQLAEQADHLTDLSHTLEKLLPEKSDLTQIKTERAELLQQALAAQQEWQRHWDAHQSQQLNLVSQMKVTDTKLTHQQDLLQRLQQRSTHLKARQNEFSVTDQQQLDPLMQELTHLSERLQQLTTDLGISTQAISQQQSNNKQIQTHISEQRRLLQEQERRYAGLQALQQAAFDANSKSTQEWLGQKGLLTQSRLGQQLRVNAPWERAAETVLNHYLGAICVDNLEDWLNSLSDFSTGEITLVAKNAAQSNSIKENTLATQISSPWPLAYWLNSIYLALNLEEALARRANLLPHESFITPDGVWVGANWLRIKKPASAEESILWREQQLAEWKQQLSQQQTILADAEQQLRHGENEVTRLLAERDGLQTQQQQTNKEVGRLQADLAAAKARLEGEQKQQQQLQHELTECMQQMLTTEQEIAQLTQAQQEFKAAKEAWELENQKWVAQRQTHEAQVANTRVAVRETEQALDAISVRIATIENEIGLIKQSNPRDERRLAQLKERATWLEEKLTTEATPLHEWQGNLQSLLSESANLEAQLTQSKAILSQHTERLRELTHAHQQTGGSLTELREKLEKQRVNLQTTIVRQTTIIEQLTAEGFELAVVLNELPENATIQEWEAQLATVTQRIQRLGAINLAAIEEYQTISERKLYLDQQQADLLSALDMLDKAMRKIDTETKQLFSETFEKVNQNFQTLFPKIFNGGRASLELLEEDWLNAGVTVRAQPPGKRNSTIHMLSGGEKALTAIALVFAMFQINPAPFCILDEVDAPLDDLNVGRFGDLVKQMSKDVQFLMISHNKVSIAMADQLMGVTMQEPGVSRLVMVDMSEAIAMVEA